MIQFEYLTISAADPIQTRADYLELFGARTDRAGHDPLPLDNLELRVKAAGAPAGIETVGLVGEIEGDTGRWTLGSASASTATKRSEVPFEAGDGESRASIGGSKDPAAIHAVDHIVIRSRDVDATRDLFEKGFGVRVLFDRGFPDWKMRLCMCRVGDAVLEIAGALPSESAERETEAREPSADAVADEAPSEPRDRLWGVTWRVRDIGAAHARLQASGFDVSEVRTGRRPGTRVFTVRDRTGGVPTLIIQPAD